MDHAPALLVGNKRALETFFITIEYHYNSKRPYLSQEMFPQTSNQRQVCLIHTYFKLFNDVTSDVLITWQCPFMIQ